LVYSDFKHKHPHIGAVSEEMQKLLELQPLVKEAYHRLGDEKVSNLRYTKSKVKDALEAIDDNKNQDDKIMSILEHKLENDFYSSVDLKKILADVYATVGKNQTATADDIERWYEAKSMVKKIKGKSVRGYVIIKPKYVYDSSIAYT
jgi:ribosome-binding factor A